MNVLFLVARALHVVFAALWLGGVVVLMFFVEPAAESMGPEGGKLMGALQRKGIHIFMPSIAGLTVLLGLYLYWHFTAGFDPTISGSTGGIVFGIGGVLGIIALIIGGSVVGRGTKALGEMGPKLAAADPATRAKLMGEMESIRGRVRTFGRLVVALVTVTTILMALGHYV
jgi:uncharacterized membrane protein